MDSPSVEEEDAQLRVQIEDLRAALGRSEQGRLAAEERASQAVQGQRAALQQARELLSLQSLFKHAVEENRGLMVQLQACRVRIAQLEAVGGPAAAGAPCGAQEPEALEARRYPPLPSLSEMQAAAVREAAPQGGSHLLPTALPPYQQQQEQHQELPGVQQPQPPPANPDLQRVYGELQALQLRLQAAEQRLQLQPLPPAASQQQQQRYPTIQPLAAHAAPASADVNRWGNSSSGSPKAACRPPSPTNKHQEHRDSWQLIRELKQRRAQLEAARQAAASAELASRALESHVSPRQQPEPRPTSTDRWRRPFHHSSAAGGGAGRSTSRSRSEQAEVDWLLMAGRPTTLLGSGSDGSGGGGSRAYKRQGRRGMSGSWVEPLVLA
ncbi:hypothetical protein CHLNCDRAFT_137181 [Chlorella variabilis]|uniref:Uncharacterized protein n=1 Tax=Chlorella variabilis TaxID=554065 RepID=E1ZLF4_CHLVA|nr:hypothetical protein CHLNCDRAFT_137181 [Chlorella variabilis]EFN53259.1 hypothetical protein CHLNCDRAFT_137181 [Chlorella variabilis]|eukprot:XP_005845361.1 hypothetical protein CHLNCDRAFT_137181 [Chlorella variabilis]